MVTSFYPTGGAQPWNPNPKPGTPPTTPPPDPTTPPPPDTGQPGLPSPGTPPPFTPPSTMDPYTYTQQYQSGSSAQTQSQTGEQLGNTNQNQLNENIYDPNSLALRNLGADMLTQVMATGQLPGNFGISNQAFDAAARAFERHIAPGMAAQYGAGSPAIPSQKALMFEQLAAQLSRDQWTNFNNVFDEVANFSFTPTGQKGNMQQQQATSEAQQGVQAGTWQTNNTQQGALLSALLSAMAGGAIGRGGNLKPTPPPPGGGTTGGTII